METRSHEWPVQSSHPNVIVISIFEFQKLYTGFPRGNRCETSPDAFKFNFQKSTLQLSDGINLSSDGYDPPERD